MSKRISRRSVVRIAGASVVGGGIAAIGLPLVSQSAVAASTSLSTSDVRMTSNAGQLQTLYIQPDMQYQWNGLDNPPREIEFHIDARLPNADGDASTFEEIGVETTSIDSTKLESETNQQYTFQNRVSILSHSGIADNGSDFEKKGGSWSKETVVELRIRSVLTDEADQQYTGTSQASFSVSLTNEKGSVNSGGAANAGGSAR